MAEAHPAAPPDTTAPAGPLRSFALLGAQVAFLCLLFAGWLGIGRLWRLPLPAGLLAMLSLTALLLAKVLPLAFVQRGAALLLRYIGLLFVPVCVGAVRQLPFLRTQGWAFALLVVAGALVGQSSTGLLAQALCRKPADRQAPEGFGP
jgi:holin-like protein